MVRVSGCDISRACRYVHLSRLAVERMHRTGQAPGGAPLWTDQENAPLRKFYPDYVELLKRLPRRSYYSLRRRADKLGIVQRRHVWTAAEVSRLRRHYPSASRKEIFELFPGLRWLQISQKARLIGVHRKTRKLVSTGHALVDEVRSRATTLGYTMVDLDELASTGTYFQKGWWRKKQVSARKIARAVTALGGRLTVKWEE